MYSLSLTPKQKERKIVLGYEVREYLVRLRTKLAIAADSQHLFNNPEQIPAEWKNIHNLYHFLGSVEFDRYGEDRSWYLSWNGEVWSIRQTYLNDVFCNQDFVVLI